MKSLLLHFVYWLRSVFVSLPTRRVFLFMLMFVALPWMVSPLSAQWVKESYPLKAGWNGIWVSMDCSDRTMDKLLESYPSITEVWRWNPLASSVQFIDSPSAPISPDARWAVWRRGDLSNSTFGSLTGNAAYLVSVASGTPDFTIELLGKPLVPSYTFSSSGLNLMGFPAKSPELSSARNFETYFSFSETLKNNPSVFAYRGGPMSSSNPKNPYELTTPRFTAVSRGKAYWVKSHAYSEYYGPLKVTVLGIGGIDFGRKLNTVKVRVKNVTDSIKNQMVTAHFTLVSSLPAPGSFTASNLFPLRVRGEINSDLQFTYQSFQDAGGTIDLTLAPGESRDLVLNANRTQMMAADQLYEGVLQVTDSLGHTQIDLPVSGVGSSRHGMWVGTAVIDSVNRVETISGEEYDAPVGTVDGIVSKGSSLKSVTSTTADGVSTQKTSYNVHFDAGGFADLPLIDDEVNQITLTSVDDDDETPDFSEGTDYEIVASPLAQVTKEGGGYTEAPAVRFEGGSLESPATGTAVLSASVHRVKMTDAGSGYKRQVVDVIFSGGGGVDAKGHIVLDEGG